MIQAGSELILARLLRTPKPHGDENLNGFLLRVAEENGFDNLHGLLKQVSSSLTVAATPSDVKGLSVLLNVEPATLQNMAYWPMAHRPRAYRAFRGIELRNYHVQMDPCRICPECMREAPYCRAVWDIRLVCACPKHGTILLDRCQGCQTPISWRRRSVTKCNNCQADFRGFRPARAGVGALAVCQAIHRAVQGGHGLHASPKDLPEFMKVAPAIQLLDFIKFLGSYGVSPRGELERVRLPRRNPEYLHQMLEAAATALENWPVGFHGLLDKVRTTNAGKATRTGLSGQFGDFYITLMRRFSTGPLNDVKEAFLGYISKDGGRAFATKRSFKFDLTGERDFMTRPEVAEYLGISSQTVDVLLRDGEIEGNTHPMGMTRTHGVFSRASVENYSARRRHVIESRAAAARMGLSSVSFRQLVDGGLLEPHARSTFRSKKAYEIDERKIDNLLTKLDLVVTSPPFKAGTNYHNATVRLGNVGLTGVDLLRSALTKETRVIVFRETAAGLRRYLFCTADIDKLIAEHGAKIPPRSVLSGIADALQIEPRHVSRLVGRGLLRSRISKGGLRTIPSSELDRFKSRYVSVRELARQQGRPAKYILDAFCGSGGRPVLGRSLGIGSTFVERKHASEIFGERNAA